MSILTISHRKTADVIPLEGAWQERGQTESGDGVPISWCQSRYDDETLWSSASDAGTQLHAVVAGRIALPGARWSELNDVPGSGGLAARHVLRLYADHGESFDGHLNGAFAVAVIDSRRMRLILVTDRLGYNPVFAWNEADRPVLSTHPDVVARHLTETPRLDTVSIAQVLAYGRATHPHTYYQDIRALEPGHVYIWEAGKLKSKRAYWTPEYKGTTRTSKSDLTDGLVAAWHDAVNMRSLPHVGPVGVLLSGGADSRAVLYATSDPESVTSITLYNEENAEYLTARALAQRIGSRHIGLQRSFEHYGWGARESVRVTGGMWNYLDAHYTMLADRIRDSARGTLLTGCHADYLFKGLASNRRHRRLLGRALPIYDFAPFTHNWYVPRGKVAAEIQEAVTARLHSQFDGLDIGNESDESRWEIERRRMMPIAYEPDTAGRLYLSRALRWDPIFADSSLIEMWERIPPSLKVNGQIWEAAVASICRSAGDVLNNNSQARIGVSNSRKVASFLRGVIYRKMFGHDVDGSDLDGFVGRGSWPNFSYYYLHSKVIPELWTDSDDSSRPVLSEILGFDPWSRPLEDWAQSAHVFSRVLTVKLWLDSISTTPTMTALSRGESNGDC